MNIALVRLPLAIKTKQQLKIEIKTKTTTKQNKKKMSNFLRVISETFLTMAQQY